jgi:hypothetical protein
MCIPQSIIVDGVDGHQRRTGERVEVGSGVVICLEPEVGTIGIWSASKIDPPGIRNRLSDDEVFDSTEDDAGGGSLGFGPGEAALERPSLCVEGEGRRNFEVSWIVTTREYPGRSPSQDVRSRLEVSGRSGGYVR